MGRKSHVSWGAVPGENFPTNSGSGSTNQMLKPWAEASSWFLGSDLDVVSDRSVGKSPLLIFFLGGKRGGKYNKL